MIQCRGSVYNWYNCSINVFTGIVMWFYSTSLFSLVTEMISDQLYCNFSRPLFSRDTILIVYFAGKHSYAKHLPLGRTTFSGKSSIGPKCQILKILITESSRWDRTRRSQRRCQEQEWRPTGRQFAPAHLEPRSPEHKHFFESMYIILFGTFS